MPRCGMSACIWRMRSSDFCGVRRCSPKENGNGTLKNTLDTVLNYHRRSKHHLQRYAAGPGGLDWKNQPDPFRHFTGCARWEMPLLGKSHRPRYADLYQPGKIAPLALTRNNLAALLELAFGLSARVQYGGNTG